MELVRRGLRPEAQGLQPVPVKALEREPAQGPVRDLVLLGRPRGPVLRAYRALLFSFGFTGYLPPAANLAASIVVSTISLAAETWAVAVPFVASGSSVANCNSRWIAGPAT